MGINQLGLELGGRSAEFECQGESVGVDINTKYYGPSRLSVWGDEYRFLYNRNKSPTDWIRWSGMMQQEGNVLYRPTECSMLRLWGFLVLVKRLTDFLLNRKIVNRLTIPIPRIKRNNHDLSCDKCAATPNLGPLRFRRHPRSSSTRFSILIDTV